MTTTTENTTTITSPHWAAEAGARLAARRAERQAERAAEAQAEGTRAALPTAELRRLFADVAGHTLANIDAFATAGGIRVEAAPSTATQVELHVGGDEVLRLTLRDDSIHVMIRSRSYGTEESLTLSDPDFSPEPAARKIAEQYIRQIAAAMEALDGAR
jgi:hypothetical protein